MRESHSQVEYTCFLNLEPKNVTVEGFVKLELQGSIWK